MAGEKLNFPSRAQRKALLKELLDKEQDPQAAQNEFFQDYLQAMKKLDAKMEELSAEDEKGVPKNLTKEDAEKLSGMMLDAATYGERYLAFNMEGDKPAAGLPTMVDKLQGLMAKDYEALAEYDPEKPQSLPELQESTRTLTIDLRGRKLGTVGNMQNSRIPMTVVNSAGKKRRGVFTKATYMSAKKDYDDWIAKAKAACKTEEQKKELDKFLAGYRDYAIKHGTTYSGGRINDKTSDTYLLGRLCVELNSKYNDNPDVQLNKDGTLPMRQTKEFLAKYGVNVNLLPKAALEVMRKGLSQYKDNIALDINAERLEIDDGQRIDNRNTAMSAVAGLLGCSKMVCRADNMRFIGEDGKVTEGTFMDYAEGVDLIKKPELFKHVAINPFKKEENRRKLNRQLVDCQVLDYLCNNEDRHRGNMMYDIDQDGQLRGVQLFDNDSSFGLSSKSPKKLRVVSKSMANKLENLTPEMLKFALRGRGLTEDELNAAAYRLSQLKADIKHGELTVMSDEQLGRYTPEKLQPKDPDATNLFTQIDLCFNETAKLYRGDTPFTPLPEQPKPDLKEVSSTSRKHTLGGLTDSLAQVSRKVENEETGFKVDGLRSRFRGSSPKYDAMVTAAKEANALYKKLTGKLPGQEEGKLPDLSKLVSEDPETLGKVIEAFVKVDQTTSEYLNYKTKQRGAEDVDSIIPKNDYEKAHINYAKDLKKITGDFLSSRRPTNEAEREDLQANTARRELEKRRTGEAQQEKPKEEEVIQAPTV